MKNIIKIVLLSLVASIGSNSARAQAPDSVLLHLDEDSAWVFVQKNVFSFIMENHAEYTAAIPYGNVESTSYTVDGINYVYMSSTSTSTEIEDVVNHIKADPDYVGSFEVINFWANNFESENYIPTRNLIEVVFEEEVMEDYEIDDFATTYNLRVLSYPPNDWPVGAKYVYTFETLGTENLAFESAIDKCNEIYYAGEAVEIIHPDVGMIQPHTAPNDTLYPYQWGLENDGTFGCWGGTGFDNADANIREAWNRNDEFGYGASYSGLDVEIAVIDFDNFQVSHRDLNGQFLDGYNTLDSTVINGNVYLTFNGAAHGTYVSGIIGAKADNNEGMIGVAYGAKMRPYLITVWDHYLTTALQKLVKSDVSVINMSLGNRVFTMAAAQGLGSYTAIKTLSTRGRDGKGMVMIASAGNHGDNVITAPACYTEVLSVGASTPQDSIKRRGDDFSPPPLYDWGSNVPYYLDVVAPGACIWGADLEGQYGTNPDPDFHYDIASGTSAAAPIVSGLAALLLERDPNLTADQVYTAIRNGTDQIGGYNYSADPTRPGWSPQAGYGRVNGYKIVHLTPVGQSETQVDWFDFKVQNPFKNKLFIDFGKTGDYQVTIVDIQGKQQLQIAVSNKKELSVDAKQLSAGSYVLQVQDNGTQKVGTRKLIKY